MLEFTPERSETMAYYIEITTPLKLIGIRFFKDTEGRIWIKVFNKPRRPLFQKRKAS